MNKIKLYFSAIACAMALNACNAQNGMTTKAAYMYKNGYAWFLNYGNVKLNNGTWKLEEREIPQAIKGSFWFESPAGINYVLRRTDTTMKTVFQPGLEELFRLNLNKTVKLVMSTGSTTVNIDGIIIKVFFTPEDSLEFYQTNPVVAVIRTAQAEVVITRDNLARILYSEFGSGAIFDLKKKSISSNLTVYTKEKPANTELNMAYLSNHPGWEPIYRLVMDKNGKSYLTLGAELSSGSQDLKNTEINLVVGEPSFYYGGLTSRLVGNHYSPVFDRMQEDNGGEMDDYEPAHKVSVARAEALPPVSVDPSQSADFYIYTIKNFSLQKNQSAYVQILNESVDLEHKYECQLPGVNMYGGVSYPNIEESPIQPVFHFLKFKNPVKQNLTDAPIFIENGENGKDIALGQPRMEMIPVGGTAKVLLAQNPDLPVKMAEEETSRIANAYSLNNRNETLNFDLVTMKSAIHMENQGKKDMVVKLSRLLEGKTLTSDLPWTVNTTKPTMGSPNSNNNVSWEVKLKPGEKKDFSFSYQYYLRIY